MSRVLTHSLVALLALSYAARAADSEEARLKKLEEAVAALQKENAQLKQALQRNPTGPIEGPVAPSGPAAPLNKIKLSDSVTEVRLYGEGRLRYFLNEGEAAGLDHGDHGDRDRLRYRLRLGADIKVQDNWMLGVLVEENNSARSSNVTLGENPTFAKGTVSKNSAGVVSNVNFGDALFLGRVFLKYDPTSWLTLQGGRMANPFVTSRMVWDPDINPEGFAEQFRYAFNPFGAANPDGKTALVRTGPEVDLFANFGQFIYDDVGFENAFNGGNGPFSQTPNSTDRWMLGWQLGARLRFNPDTFVQVAPAFYHYTGGGSTSAGAFNGDSPIVQLDRHADPTLITFNQTGTNDLSFIEVPVEFDWKWHDVPMSLFGDYSYNFEADSRADKAGHDNKGGQASAYQFGASVGKTGHRGDWEMRGWWQHSEAYALDQNIIDDDIFDGRLNMEGFFVQASYNLTDALSFILQYSHGERIDKTLGTPGFGALGTSPGFPLERTNLFYVDVNLRF